MFYLLIYLLGSVLRAKVLLAWSVMQLFYLLIYWQSCLWIS